MKRELNAIRAWQSDATKRFESMDKRFDGIERRLDGHEKIMRRIAIDLVGVKNELTAFQDSVKNVIRNEFSRIQVLMDDLAPFLEAARRDRAANDKAHMRHYDRFEDHERRLRRLETRHS